MKNEICFCLRPQFQRYPNKMIQEKKVSRFFFFKTKYLKNPTKVKILRAEAVFLAGCQFPHSSICSTNLTEEKKVKRKKMKRGICSTRAVTTIFEQKAKENNLGDG